MGGKIWLESKPRVVNKFDGCWLFISGELSWDIISHEGRFTRVLSPLSRALDMNR